MNSRIRLIGVSTVGVLVGLAIGLPFLFGADDAREKSREPLSSAQDVSTLDESTEGRSALPKELLADRATSDQFARPIQAAQAGSEDGLTFYLIEGIDDQVCLAQTSGENETFSSATACSPRKMLVELGSIYMEGIGVTKEASVVGVAADGYEAAMTADGGQDGVTDNVFVVHPEDPYQQQELTLSGEGVEEQAIEIGLLEPPAIENGKSHP